MGSARLQTFQGGDPTTLTTAGTLYQINATVTYVKSCSIQAPTTNTGTVTVCTSDGKFLCELLPNKAVTIQGDAMDHGGDAMFDTSQFYAKSTVNGDKVYLSFQNGV